MLNTLRNALHQKPPETQFELVKFETYEDYLDSLYSNLDKCYLQDTSMCRKIAELSYRSDGHTFSRKEFTKIRKKILSYLSPIQPNIISSSGFTRGDPAQNALAIRERANRVGLIATIIFISHISSKGQEISGYIDYAQSLLEKDWHKFFHENVPIYPDRHDLGYYNWKKDTVTMNNSLNFKSLMSPTKGLIFQHKFDRKTIVPDPFDKEPKENTTRKRVKSKMYNICVLIDHMLRVRK